MGQICLNHSAPHVFRGPFHPHIWPIFGRDFCFYVTTSTQGWIHVSTGCRKMWCIFLGVGVFSEADQTTSLLRTAIAHTHTHIHFWVQTWCLVFVGPFCWSGLVRIHQAQNRAKCLIKISGADADSANGMSIKVGCKRKQIQIDAYHQETCALMVQVFGVRQFFGPRTQRVPPPTATADTLISGDKTRLHEQWPFVLRPFYSDTFPSELNVSGTRTHSPISCSMSSVSMKNPPAVVTTQV